MIILLKETHKSKLGTTVWRTIQDLQMVVVRSTKILTRNEIKPTISADGMDKNILRGLTKLQDQMISISGTNLKSYITFALGRTDKLSAYQKKSIYILDRECRYKALYIQATRQFLLLSFRLHITRKFTDLKGKTKRANMPRTISLHL